MSLKDKTLDMIIETLPEDVLIQLGKRVLEKYRGNEYEAVLFAISDIGDINEYYKFLYNIAKELYPTYNSTKKERFINYNRIYSHFKRDDLDIIESLKFYSELPSDSPIFYNMKYVVLYELFYIGFGVEESNELIRLIDKYDGRKYFCIDKFPKYSWISISYFIEDINVNNTIEYTLIDEVSEPRERDMINQYVYRFM